ncbi:MAG TPA: hypothetical protein DCX25_03810 [Candidatus Pacebacteria bacterium]|nr:MAG: dTDP-4-dehydrorhamnose reductase [Microgenomates group bacterium GW2011_GWB1_45_17]KKU24785.1 MAG: dTDP-4-dehydrorhamnose reductase [Microgenomates group bacterium GW2011_GWC1_46_15]HAV15431.1 hypothetical protein [Candidatus Paceibacterota bacterium]HCR11510.1 hypothetical protein [Candidatus Paceibacterota bacterium]HCR92941.1 hypothetical protein [Candidatus Paceibacterota bacterium]
MNIAVTGFSGLLGRTLQDCWHGDDIFVDMYHRHPTDKQHIQHISLDLLDQKNIVQTLRQVHPDVIIHMAAMTHIDACELDKQQGKAGAVWKINVDATRAIGTYAAETGAHVVYLSTECVFDGEKDMYKEHEEKHPKNWYGETKSEGENALLSLGIDLSIIRSVIAYRPMDSTTVFGKIVDAYKKGIKFPAVSNQFFMPTHAEDIISAIEHITHNHLFGTFHIVPPEHITPLSFALEIGTHFGYDTSLVYGQTLEEYFGIERAKLRLKHACLDAALSQKVLGKSARIVREVLRKLSK